MEKWLQSKSKGNLKEGMAKVGFETKFYGAGRQTDLSTPEKREAYKRKRGWN